MKHWLMGKVALVAVAIAALWGSSAVSAHAAHPGVLPRSGCSVYKILAQKQNGFNNGGGGTVTFTAYLYGIYNSSGGFCGEYAAHAYVNNSVKGGDVEIWALEKDGKILPGSPIDPSIPPAYTPDTPPAAGSCVAAKIIYTDYNTGNQGEAETGFVNCYLSSSGCSCT